MRSGEAICGGTLYDKGGGFGCTVMIDCTVRENTLPADLHSLGTDAVAEDRLGEQDRNALAFWLPH